MTDKDPNEAAGLWRARLESEDATDADRAACGEWRAADPANEAAWTALEAIYGTCDDGGDHPEIQALRAAVAAEASPDRRPRAARLAAAAAALIVVAGAAAFAALNLAQPPGDGTYQTAVGERSTITLRDGSQIVLNTKSRVTVDYEDATRRVALLEGQALFEVAKDPERPFIVEAGDRRITALGTAFDVRLDADEVRVTLVEGRVAVDPITPAPKLAAPTSETPAQPPAKTSPLEAAPGGVELAPGEQLVAVHDAEAAVVKTDVMRVTSWREGRLIFEDERLADVIAEVNRYSKKPIVLGDEALGDRQLSAVFQTGDAALVVDALTGFLPLKARERPDGSILLVLRE